MITRRGFAARVAAAAAAGWMSRSVAAHAAEAPAARRVIVIGAGIVGCSIAWHLARRGASVTLLEARKPAAQASGHSLAWLNGGDGDQPLAYHVLREYALGEHRRIATELAWPVRWGGALEWRDAPVAELEQHVHVMQRRGADMRSIDARELRAIEPGLVVPRGTKLAYAPHDGALDAVRATQVLFDAAIAAGARAVVPARVTAIEPVRTGAGGDGVVVVTDSGRFEADTVVVAAGVGATAIAAMAGLSLLQKNTPGIIAITEPLPRVLNTVLYGPVVHMHQRDDGCVVLGEKAGPADLEVHRLALPSLPNEFPASDIGARHGARILAAATQQVPALARAKVREIGIGWRPMPADGLPLIGRFDSAPALYFAVMHSGMTLAPLVGRLVATELLDGVELDALAAFRSGRLAAE